MRRNVVLMQQHIGRMFRQNWKVQGQRLLLDNGALKSLKEHGIEYEDANDVIKDPPKERPNIVIRGYKEEKKIEKTEPYLHFGDNHVLVGGLDQAQVFSNSIRLPHETLSVFKAEESERLPLQDKLVRRCIKSSLLFDAYQEKLPKCTDPERPAWNFPRDYGITDRRRNRLLVNRLLQLCSSASPQLLEHRRITGEANFIVPFEREGDKIILNLRGDSLVLSRFGITPPSASLDQKILDEAIETGLPELYPFSQLISIQKNDDAPLCHNFFPLTDGIEPNQIHTAVIHYNPTEVTNLYDVDVTKEQILGRSLMKAYAIAVAQARYNYGNDVEELPKPITVQCVQTDSQNFHFLIFQLNTTLCSSKTEKRNFYWFRPEVPIYNTCQYVDGVPVFEGYNPTVFKTLLAFYYNN